MVSFKFSLDNVLSSFVNSTQTLARLVSKGTEMSNIRHYVFLLLVISRCCQTKETLYIGGLFGIDTSRGGWNSAGIIPAVQMAIDEINNNSGILKDYHLELLIKDSQVGITNEYLILENLRALSRESLFIIQSVFFT